MCVYGVCVRACDRCATSQSRHLGRIKKIDFTIFACVASLIVVHLPLSFKEKKSQQRPQKNEVSDKDKQPR